MLDTHVHACPRAQICPHMTTHVHVCQALTLSHALTCPHMYMSAHVTTYAHTCPHMPTHNHVCRTHTSTCGHTYSLALTYTHTLSLSHVPTHTLNHANALECDIDREERASTPSGVGIVVVFYRFRSNDFCCQQYKQHGLYGYVAISSRVM